jgi:hypothetical protein
MFMTSICMAGANLPNARSRPHPPRKRGAAGGPVAYALAWIEDAAQDPAWIALQAQRRQGVLF